MAYPLQFKRRIGLNQKLRLVITEVVFNLVASFILGNLRIYFFFSETLAKIKNALFPKPENLTIKRY